MTAIVKALPVFKLNDIPEALRQLANRIDSGEFKAPERIVIAIEYDTGKLTYKAFGAEPFSNGLCDRHTDWSYQRCTAL